jgi:hypothetical protein
LLDEVGALRDDDRRLQQCATHGADGECSSTRTPSVRRALSSVYVRSADAEAIAFPLTNGKPEEGQPPPFIFLVVCL